MSVSRNAGRSGGWPASSFSSSVTRPCDRRSAASGRIDTRPRRIVLGDWADRSCAACSRSVMRAGCHPPGGGVARTASSRVAAGASLRPGDAMPVEPDRAAIDLGRWPAGRGSGVMRPVTPPNPMFQWRRRLTPMLVVLLVAACDSSVVPSASPGSPSASPRPSVDGGVPVAGRSALVRRQPGCEPPAQRRRGPRPGRARGDGLRSASRPITAPRRRRLDQVRARAARRDRAPGDRRTGRRTAATRGSASRLST